MHIFTLVITPGPRGGSYERTGRLLLQAAPQRFDYWSVGGRCEGRLQELGLVASDDPWPEAITVSQIPNPVPELLVPGILVTPRGAWLRGPLWSRNTDEDAKWAARVNRLIDQYSGGHTAVVIDAHC